VTRPAIPRTFQLLLTATLLAWSATAVSAPPSPTDLTAARALFKQAEADEQGGRWSEALVKLRQAASVKMTAGLRFHIAVCEEKSGHLVAALADYTAAQTLARDTDNREVLGLVSEPLLALKLRMPTVTIALPPTPRGPDNAPPEVRLDGATVPAASVGIPIPIDVGTHTVEASAVGQALFTRTFVVVERAAEPVVIVFTPTVIATSVKAEPPPAPAPSVEPPRRHSSTLAIVATAGAVVLVGAGVAAFAAAGSDQSYWQGVCRGQGPACGNAGPVRTWDAVALGAWVAGAGAGTVAVVLWTRPINSEARGIDAVRASLRAGPGTLWLSAAF